MSESFSVLISIYVKERADFLRVALKSVWDDQTVKPQENVLVKDGPLTEELDYEILQWSEKLGEKLVVISLRENVGLGDALRVGLEKCQYELVARMDTDDISHPSRFEKQIDYLLEHPEIDILGSDVLEFDQDPLKPIARKSVPSKHDQLLKYARSRNPFNHPSVIYKRSKVLKVGNYQKFIGFEDYYLWVRMLLSGCQGANYPEPLVLMRSGLDMLGRRGGWSYLVDDFLFQYKLYQLKFVGRGQWMKNLCIRIPVRLLPVYFRRWIYKSIRIFKF